MTEPKHQEPSTKEEKSVTPSANNPQISGEPKAVWHMPFSYIASLSNDERIRFITAITIAALVLLGGVVATLLILVQFFDIGIDNGVIAIRPRPPEGKVPPTAGSPPGTQPAGKLNSGIIRSYQKEAAERDGFRRNWIGPDGEEVSSNDLDPCLLVPAPLGQPRWGQLLAQVMKEQPGLS